MKTLNYKFSSAKLKEENAIVDVSFIIVSWNAKKHLIDCLKSIISPSGDYTQEIIVIDNGSNDGSAAVVEKDFPQVRLIKNPNNFGFSRANNIGILESKGKYLALINSDIIVLDTCINELMRFMNDNSGFGMVGPLILNKDNTLQQSCRYFPGLWNNLCHVFFLNKLFPRSKFFSEPFMGHWPHDEIKKVDAIRGCFWFVRRRAVEEVGLLDENFFFYGEDIDWCKRFNMTGWEIVFYPGARAIHYGGASSSNAPLRFYKEMNRADLIYWQKYYGYLGQFSYRIIIFLRHFLRLFIYTVMYFLKPICRDEYRYKQKRALESIILVFTLRLKEKPL